MILATALGGASPDEARVQTRDGRSWTAPARIEAGRILLEPEGQEAIPLSLTNLDYLIWTRRPTTVGQPSQGNGKGLIGAFHAHTNLLGPSILQLDPAVNISEDRAASFPAGFQGEAFGVIWTGHLQSPRSGLYTVYFSASGQVRLWVNEQGPATLGPHEGDRETQLTLNLIAGERYPLRAEYTDTSGTPKAQLLWSNDQVPKSVIPTEWLHPGGPTVSNMVQITGDRGLLATYYADPSFEGQSFTRVEPGVEASWQATLPPTMPALRDTWLTHWDAWRNEVRELQEFRVVNRLAMAPTGGPVDDHDLRTAFLARLNRAEEELQKAVRRRQELRGQFFKAQLHVKEQASKNALTPEDTAALETARLADQGAEGEMQAAQSAFNKLRFIQAEEKRRENHIEDLKRRTRVALEQYRLASMALRNPVVPGVPRNLFSVRWTGLVTAPRSDDYTFHVRTDEGLRFWMEDQLWLDDWQQTNLTEHTVSRRLEANQPVRIRMESRNTDDRGEAAMDWSSATIARGPVPSEALAPCLPPAVGPAPRPFISPDFPAGLVLRNGTVLSGAIQDADRDRARLMGRLERWPVPISNLARLHFRPLTRTQVDQLTRAEPGALLVDGDYVEGELVGFKNGRLTLSSVLFGIRRFDAEDQVQAVVLRQGAARLPQWMIRAVDGSAIYADQVTLEPGGLSIPSLAGLHLSGQDLWHIQWLHPGDKREAGAD